MPAYFYSSKNQIRKPIKNNIMMWQNKTRPNKTAGVPHAYIPSEEDPFVFIPDPEATRWMECPVDDRSVSKKRISFA